jgi:hypothetical protein
MQREENEVFFLYFEITSQVNIFHKGTHRNSSSTPLLSFHSLVLSLSLSRHQGSRGPQQGQRQ